MDPPDASRYWPEEGCFSPETDSYAPERDSDSFEGGYYSSETAFDWLDDEP